jgi:branched-chain amino acid transport system ATP-binding protein
MGPPAGTSSLLLVEGLTKRFSGLCALDDVGFDVPAGSVLGIIGPNGAGKTTLYNCMTGFSRPDSGRVCFGGKVVTGWPAHRLARAGMVRTFQSIKMLKGLTVYESLLCSRPRSGSSMPARRRRAETVLGQLELTAMADRRCEDLPLLGQRTVEVARALMTEPLAMLLDEPTAGATVPERVVVAALIRSLRGLGVTTVIIEHNVPFILDISDQVVVLNFGKVLARGDPQEVVRNPVVEEIYLGV